MPIADDCGAANTALARDSHVVRDALHAVRDSMSEDERMWLHYRRDVECHVWQDAYELNRRGNGLKEKRRFALLSGQEMHIDEIAKRSSALMRKYNVDEPAMAVHFAKLVAPHVARVLLALAPLYRSA
ncbi:MAG: hypothetical protein AB7T06_07065 [Kofleriaceae bacterium]